MASPAGMSKPTSVGTPDSGIGFSLTGLDIRWTGVCGAKNGCIWMWWKTMHVTEGNFIADILRFERRYRQREETKLGTDMPGPGFYLSAL